MGDKGAVKKWIDAHYSQLKTAAFVAGLALSSAATSGVAVSYTFADKVKAQPVNTSLFLADNETERRANDREIAAHGQQLIGITAELQEGRDDRKTIHDEIYKLTETEQAHYNQLNDRMNVSDARTGAVGWVLGVLFTLTQSVLLFFHIGDRQKRGRRSTDKETEVRQTC